MKEEKTPKTSWGSAYESPKVNEVGLDKGGNYKGSAWPQSQNSSDGSAYTPLGSTIVP